MRWTVSGAVDIPDAQNEHFFHCEARAQPQARREQSQNTVRSAYSLRWTNREVNDISVINREVNDISVAMNCHTGWLFERVVPRKLSDILVIGGDEVLVTDHIRFTTQP